MTNRYTVQGAQGEFQSGSSDLVLANKLGITSVDGMNMDYAPMKQLFVQALNAGQA